MSLENFVRALPKIELHCHLYGSVRKRTFEEMTAVRNAPFTADQIDQFYTRPRKPWPTNNVLRALDDFLIRDPGDLYRLTFEYLEDSAMDGVRYSEFFWNPSGGVNAGMPYADAQDAIVRAIRDAEAQLGIMSRLIPAIDRERGPAAAIEMVQWVVQHREPDVVGIGIDFNEADHPPELFTGAFRLARQAGLRLTAHAGENGVSWKNIRTAIETLGVERIDHGYTIVDSPELARACVESSIVFTVVPTNSYYLRTLPDERFGLDHPIRQMRELGLRVHPNTDNPTLHKVTPTRAWMMMLDCFGYTIDDLRTFIQNGIDGAWVDDAQRSKWRREWIAEFNALRADLGDRYN